ncbi:MAG: B12-binding domain-containing radical SAM protein [Candidatus Omnitrophica bacterium]|nr:B12-binding domain-containing radical SAM protein [Candidatus Omnitrophota bacterium]
MGISKITLAYPNFKWGKWSESTGWSMFPYNLCLIAAMVEKKYEVNILDTIQDNMTEEQFAQELDRIKPDVLGLSVITSEYAESGLLAAKIAKQNNPRIITVIGGVSANSTPRLFAENPSVDYVIAGEGEFVFRDLCFFLDGKGDFPKKGIMYKKNGVLVDTGRAEFIQDLNSLPLPSYHLIDFNRYANIIQRESTDHPRALPFGRIRTSRGCPYNCCFCEIESIAGKKPRFRTIDNIAAELDMLTKNYGIKGLMFDDDNLIVDTKRAKALFRMMIEKKYYLKWNAPGVAVYKLDDEMLELMKESGCAYLNVAVESGSERVLKEIIDKPVDLEKAKITLGLIKKHDIDLAVNFVIGFPGETWDEIRQTIKFAEDIDVDYVKIFVAIPFPNTKLYELAKEEGYLRPDFDPNKHLWTEGWINSKDWRPQDLQILRAYEWDRINFSHRKKRIKIAKMMGVTEERLEEIRKWTLARANP